MPCRKPLEAFKTRGIGGQVTFYPRDLGQGYDRVWLPCGQCVLCRLERSRQWAMRCMHEASLYEENCFLTLTYSEENVPHAGALVHRDFQLFMKKLRQHLRRLQGPWAGEPPTVRFYMCGEYGGETFRPHYHALLFGMDFWDKTVWSSRKGFTVWRSSLLEDLWPHGLSEIGAVTFESAAYVARYIMKKVTGADAESHYLRVNHATGEVVDVPSEYTSMSKKPGIGMPWLEKWKMDVWPMDRVIVRGVAVKPPRAYERLLEDAELEELKLARQEKIDPANVHPDRLEAKAVITGQRVNPNARGL